MEQPKITFKPNKLGIALIIAVPLILLGAGTVYLIRKKKNKLGKAVADYAVQFDGYKEVLQNKGFENAEFEKLMRSKGDFTTGMAWCANFAKAMWTSVLKGEKLRLAKKLMNASSVSTFNNLKADTSGSFEFSDSLAKPGGLLFWGNPARTGGHVAVVVEKTIDGYVIIEGNWEDKVSKGKIKSLNRVFTDRYKKDLNYTFLGCINIKE